MNETDNLRQILGARDGETLFDAAARVAAEKASLEKFQQDVAVACGVMEDERDDPEYLVDLIHLNFDSYRALNAALEEKITDLGVAHRESDVLRAELAAASTRQEETQYWLDEFAGQTAKKEIELMQRPTTTDVLKELISCCEVAAENDTNGSAFWSLRCLQRALEARVAAAGAVEVVP